MRSEILLSRVCSVEKELGLTGRNGESLVFDIQEVYQVDMPGDAEMEFGMNKAYSAIGGDNDSLASGKIDGVHPLNVKTNPVTSFDRCLAS